MKISKRPEKIGDILGGVLSERGYLTICKEYEVAAHWNEIVGPSLSGITECERIEDGTVYIRVKNSSWRQELSYLKDELMKRINEVTGCKTIKEIILC